MTKILGAADIGRPRRSAETAMEPQPQPEPEYFVPFQVQAAVAAAKAQKDDATMAPE